MEQEILNHPRTLALLEQFPNATRILITHYKDIFNRSNQNMALQSSQKKLIIAANHGQLIFPGAPVCQDFGNQHFYYTSNVMNCIYDCEYCYLQGMYPSSNLVVFVNIEDTFFELEQLLAKHSVYLCISYDTDLLALDGMLNFLKSWITFALQHSNLTLEVRTKSANRYALQQLPVCKQVIYAWTLSPQSITQQYEHKTPSLNLRLQSIKEAIQLGHRVRLCLDPLLLVQNAVPLYKELITTVFQTISSDQIEDVSIGVFRISKDYLKQMRKQRPSSPLTQYPYVQSQGYCHYDEKTTAQLLTPVIKQLEQYISSERIFVWSET